MYGSALDRIRSSVNLCQSWPQNIQRQNSAPSYTPGTFTPIRSSPVTSESQDGQRPAVT